MSARSGSRFLERHLRIKHVLSAPGSLVINTDCVLEILYFGLQLPSYSQESTPPSPTSRCCFDSPAPLIPLSNACLYEHVSSETGRKAARQWIQNQTLHDTEHSIDEVLFLDFVGNVSNLRDFEIVSLFEMLDHESNGEVSFDCFYLFLTFLVAYQTAHCATFLYLFSFRIPVFFLIPAPALPMVISCFLWLP